MPVPVIMPKLSMTMEHGDIVSWYKKEGERVEAGEPLLEINTEKVVYEIEASASGTIQRILAEPGDQVPVTATIAYILQDGEDESAQPEPAQATPAQAAPAPNAQVADPAPKTGAAGVRATPAARRAAREHGIDIGSVAGSGAGGAVTSRDIFAVVAQRAQSLAETPVTIPARRVERLSDMRATIAERMTLSAKTVPQVPITVLVDFTAAGQLRERLSGLSGDSSGDRRASSVTYTDIIVKVVAAALRLHPGVNSSFGENEVHIMEDVNVGVAVAVPGGLVVPVIRKADERGLVSIARERSALVEKARNSRLGPEDTAGGTFTISNLGIRDVDWFSPIINPPQAGILGVGRIAERPVVSEGSIVPRLSAYFTLVFDHRVLDGMAAAEFLETLKTFTENPALLLA